MRDEFVELMEANKLVRDSKHGFRQASCYRCPGGRPPKYFEGH